MADASESPDTQPDGTPDTQPEAASDGGQAAKEGKRKVDDAPSLTARTRLSQDLRAALQNHQASVTQALEELLDPFVDDDERLELTTLFRAIDRLVADRQARIMSRHFTHRDQLIGEEGRQRTKRERFQKLRRLMVDLRELVRSLYGRTAVKNYLGLTQHTAREPVVLLRQARRVLRLLQDPDHARPEPKHEGDGLDWDRWIEKLATPARELERAVNENVAEAHESHDSVVKKHLDLELYDRDVNAAARWIVATFELADRKRFGRSLLPFSKSRLRRSQTESEEEPSSEPSGAGAEKKTEVPPTPPPVSAKGAEKSA